MYRKTEQNEKMDGRITTAGPLYTGLKKDLATDTFLYILQKILEHLFGTTPGSGYFCV